MTAIQSRGRSTVATTAEIRAQFPALDRVHNGQPVAYIGSGDPGTKVIFADGRELEFTDKTAPK